MKPAIVALIALFTAFLSTGQVTQTGDSGAKTPTDRPRWDWERQEELSSHSSISRRKTLPRLERKRLIEVISEQVRDIVSADHDVTSQERLAQIAAKTRIKYVHINGDARPEVVAQAGAEEAGCSPTGNCPFWIFRRRVTSYEVLLEGEAQTFIIQRTRTKGYADIVLSRHGSAFDSEAREYKFDGNVYREGSCFDVEWSAPDGNGKFHQPKTPRMSSCGTSQ